MKILCLIPPYIPSYFNAGHHLFIFSVGAYLRNNFNARVDCYDCAALNIHWKDICDILINKYDVIVVQNDYDGIDTFPRFIRYVKKLSPESKLITFGRLSKEVPNFFIKLGFDAVHFDGDYEAGVESYINYLGSSNPNDLEGILVPGSTKQESKPGKLLPTEKWILPDVFDIPYHAYGKMYQNDLNKFCGIPQKQELVVPVARGCPIGCFYCDVPKMQGKNERRLSVSDTIKYIKDSFTKLPFEYVSFYAPTFTLNKTWVKEFCEALIAEPKKYPWKCATAMRCLNEELIAIMAKAGCVRISVGIETLSKNASTNLPKCKRDADKEFQLIADAMHKYNVEMNCFIMLGLPGDSPEDIEHTIQLCLAKGIRVRPTIYTPYHQMNDEMSIDELNTFNRQLFTDNLLETEVEHSYYKLFYANKNDKSTKVMHKISVTTPDWLGL